MKNKAVEREIEKRMLRFLRHLLRKPKASLKWTSFREKRLRIKPSSTWRRTVEKDLKKWGLTWGQQKPWRE